MAYQFQTQWPEKNFKFRSQNNNKNVKLFLVIGFETGTPAGSSFKKSSQNFNFLKKVGNKNIFKCLQDFLWYFLTPKIYCAFHLTFEIRFDKIKILMKRECMSVCDTAGLELARVPRVPGTCRKF